MDLASANSQSLQKVYLHEKFCFCFVSNWEFKGAVETNRTENLAVPRLNVCQTMNIGPGRPSTSWSNGRYWEAVEGMTIGGQKLCRSTDCLPLTHIIGKSKSIVENKFVADYFDTVSPGILCKSWVVWMLQQIHDQLWLRDNLTVSTAICEGRRWKFEHCTLPHRVPP